MAGGLAILPMAPAWGQSTGAWTRRMTFDVWRNGQKIGVHTVDIDGDEGDQ